MGLASPTIVISWRAMASSSVRCPMTLSNTDRVAVTVVAACGSVLPVIVVNAPCSRVDTSDSSVSEINLTDYGDYSTTPFSQGVIHFIRPFKMKQVALRASWFAIWHCANPIGRKTAIVLTPKF
jgi:hypothetical protein